MAHQGKDPGIEFDKNLVYKVLGFFNKLFDGKRGRTFYQRATGKYFSNGSHVIFPVV